MVLWEVTLATAYFLGIRRTYRLALKIQNRLIGSNHPRIRQFVRRRVRSAFDVAVSVHKNIQHRDIEVGRNLGNWVLRWLDRMKPSAEIRPHPQIPSSRANNSNFTKHAANSGQQQTQQGNSKLTGTDSKGKLYFSRLSMRAPSLRSIPMMMRPTRPAGIDGQFRQFSQFTPAAPALDYRVGGSQAGVFRKDIALWMLQN